MARLVGLKDIHIAKVTSNTDVEYKTETPVKLFKAISAKVSVKRSEEKIHSDDVVEDILSALDSIEVEIEGDSLTMEHTALLMGSTLENGLLFDNEADMASEIALGFRARDSKGKYNFIWLYCGKFGGDDEDAYETKADKLNPQSKSLKGTFYARTLDGNFRVRSHEGELLAGDVTAKEAIANWFTTIPEPSVETPTQ